MVWADGPVVVVFALAAVFTAVGTGHKPAQAALLPTLADDPRQLAACNSVWSAVDSIGFLVGSLAAGLLIAAGGIDLALLVMALAFLVAALALAGIPADRVDPQYARLPGSSRLEELAEGFDTVRHEKRLRMVVVVLGASTLVEGAIDVLVVLVALELLDLGAAGVGWLNSAWGVGGVIGGAGAVVLITRGCNATALLIGSVLVGVPLVALTLFPAVGVAVVGLIVLGFGYATIEVAGLTLVQRLASDAVLARAFGVVEGTYWLTTGIGSLLAPAPGGDVRTARRHPHRRPGAAAGRARALAGAVEPGGVDPRAGGRVRPAARRRHVRARCRWWRSRTSRATPPTSRSRRARRSSARASPASASS